MCGSEKITEEKLPQLPYLYAIFQETLRMHSPVPIIPLRYVHEDTQLGGYFVPSGSEVLFFPSSLYAFMFFLSNIQIILIITIIIIMFFRLP